MNGMLVKSHLPHTPVRVEEGLKSKKPLQKASEVSRQLSLPSQGRDPTDG